MLDDVIVIIMFLFGHKMIKKKKGFSVLMVAQKTFKMLIKD